MKEGRKRKERGLLASSSCPIRSAWARLCPLCRVLHSLPTVGWRNGVQDRAGVSDLGRLSGAAGSGTGLGRWAVAEDSSAGLWSLWCWEDSRYAELQAAVDTG